MSESTTQPTSIESGTNTPGAKMSDAKTAAQSTSAGDRSAKTRQLLGMKGAQSGETSIWKIRLQLMKPITWIPLMWGSSLRCGFLRTLYLVDRSCFDVGSLYVAGRSDADGLYANVE